MINREKIIKLLDVYHHLTLDEKVIIDHRNGWSPHQPMTLEQVGDLLRLTRERVRQIEANAYDKLIKILDQNENNQ